jgi:hypothetical protein
VQDRDPADVSVSVDIFSVQPIHPRFAFVNYSDPETAGEAAMKELHAKPLHLQPAFIAEYPDDLDVWKKWDGSLTVVRAEPGKLIPSSIAKEFESLPEWDSGQKGDNGESPGKKRERDGSDPTQTL